MRLLFGDSRFRGSASRPLQPNCAHSILMEHPLISQLHLPRAGTLAFPRRAPVSNAANSKSRSDPARPLKQLHPSVRAFDKDLPAVPGGLAGLRPRAERENAIGARKRGDHALKRFDLFRRPNSFSRTPSAT